MEPEDNLDCPDLIEKFMANHEKSQMTSTKMVRLHGFHKYLIQWTYGWLAGWLAFISDTDMT